MNSDAQLVTQSLAGDLSSYDELTRRWSVRVCAYVAAKVRNRHVTEELAQDAFLRAFRSLATLKDPSKFGSWLLSIAHRLILDWSKAKARTEVQLGTGDYLDNNAQSTSPSVNLERQEEKNLLAREVSALPTNLQETLRMFYYDNITYRQIAELLNVSVATVNARLTQARSMLRDRMSVYESQS